MPFAWMPWRAQSAHIARVSIFSAPFDAVYGPIVSRADLARHRARVDDLAAPALDHLRRDRAGDEERARHVDVDDLAATPRARTARAAAASASPRCSRGRRSSPEARDAGRDRRLVGDVERRRDRAVDRRRPRPRTSPRVRPLIATRAPASGERPCEREAEPARRPRDERGAAGQVEEVAHRRDDGQQHVRRVRVVCSTVCSGDLHPRRRCRRPRRCSGCARSAGSSSSSRRAAAGGPRLNTFAAG